MASCRNCGFAWYSSSQGWQSSAAWRALWPFERLVQVDQRLHSLGEDADGELYLLTTAQGIPVGDTGKVWKLVPR